MILLTVGLGIVLIWFIQSQTIFDYLFAGEFLTKIRKCKICLGFWLYWGLSVLLGTTVFEGVINYEINTLPGFVLSVINAIVIDLAAYYLVEGWSKDHRIYVIK
jgi:hypothetical protein